MGETALVTVPTESTAVAMMLLEPQSMAADVLCWSAIASPDDRRDKDGHYEKSNCYWA
jgi:hypothetical protein